MSRSGISDISTKGAGGRGGQNFSLAVKILQDHRIYFSVLLAMTRFFSNMFSQNEN